MNGPFRSAGGGLSRKPADDAAAFRFEPPNLTFTPNQSVSTWASSRTDEPGIWRIGPSIELRKPCIQASEAVMFSVTWYEAPIVSVFVMIPGAWTLKSVVTIGDRVGVVEVAGAEREPIGRLVLGPQRHGEDAPPAQAAVDHLLAEELGVGVVDVAEVDVDQRLGQALVGDAPREDLGQARLDPDAARGQVGSRRVVVPLLLPDRALVRESQVPVIVELVEQPDLEAGAPVRAGRWSPPGRSVVRTGLSVPRRRRRD